MRQIDSYFNNKIETLIVTTPEILTTKMILGHYLSLFKNKDYPRNLKVMIDSTDSDIKIKRNELNEIISSAAKVCSSYHKLKEAIIVSNPTSTVIATLYTNRNKINNYYPKVFSSKHAALKWLNE